ncbi:type IV toxin-antitoxin system AbiEi family antitoxin domain-containing protein [Desulfosporosinus shakirovi]|uniref:type IV toxin-antitoxin system AbiEi family antitoxin domain-containing protein n=1 Tax=Desulfosporosinus shakirovi TaxID=2885154 RepID=UPI001E5DC377|nr:type IV toxin-antitoxin system AbiEi family antitoxin domain-containing protein [Desulfosporosinus sp. SRJS8]MCB8818878.1 type IV toxin-antitoxin system AbiEi family antitoxin domain-containing protein [Desulfosporosinus sp. SRJS8]
MDEKIESLKDRVFTSREVIEFLGVSRARLSQLVKGGKLVPIKKGIFMIDEVKQRKKEQEALRVIFYKPKKPI